MADTGNLADRVISVPSIVEYYTDEQLNSEYHSKQEYLDAINNYGAIYKVVQFSEVTKADKLKEYAREWIRKNYYDGVMSFTAKAVDLHLLGVDVEKYICGDRIPVEYINCGNHRITKTLTCMSAQYDLLKPDNSSYKIGIPSVSSSEKYRDSVKATSTARANAKPDYTKLGKSMESGLTTLIKNTLADSGVVLPGDTYGSESDTPEVN